MRFFCDRCRTQYSLRDDKIGPNGAKIRCQKCQHVIHVHLARGAADVEPLAQVALAAEDRGSTEPATPAQRDDELDSVFNRILESGPQHLQQHLSQAVVPPALPEPAATGAVWFIALNRDQVGPLTVEQVKEHFERGEIWPETLCWRQGLPSWAALSSVSELATVLAPPPPKAPVERLTPIRTRVPAPPPSVTSAFAAGSAPAPVWVAPPSPVASQPRRDEWAPSAASALATSLSGEKRRLSSLPPEPAPSAPAAPVPVRIEAVAAALADVPEAPPPVPVKPAPVEPPMGSLPPSPPPARRSRWNWKLIVAAAVAVELVAGAAVGAWWGLSRGAVTREAVADDAPPPSAARPALVPVAPAASATNAPGQAQRPPVRPQVPEKHAGGVASTTAQPPAASSTEQPITLPVSGSYLPETLGRDEVKHVVVGQRDAILRCVNKQRARQPRLTGTLVMRWTVLPNGRTTAIEPRTAALRDTYLASCLQGLIQSWSFPSHKVQGEPIDFNFTF